MNKLTAVEDSPSLKWWLLVWASVAIFGNYYVYDAIAPLAEILSTELGFTDTQIGSMNAIYSLPNIFLVLVGGLLVDKFGASRVALVTTTICLAGAIINAASPDYYVMLIGRFLFGVGAETMLIALSVAIAIRFGGHMVALAMALNLSIGRMGSYAADLSPVWAGGFYDQGWQGPLILAAIFAGISLLGAGGCWWLDEYRPAQTGGAIEVKAHEGERFSFKQLVEFDRSFWYVAALNVLFYSVIFPFRSTFAIKYFQHAQDQSLEAASIVNSYVYLAAIILTPIFGFIADRFGRRGLMMMIGSLLLPLSFAGLYVDFLGAAFTTILLGVSFATVPAILWPAIVKLVPGHLLGTAYGLLFMLQAVGIALANMVAGALNDGFAAGADNPSGYTPMIVFFAAVAAGSFVFAWLLWRRELGPDNHGLEEPR